MVKKIASLGAVVLTATIMSTGVLAHGGDNLANGSGERVLDSKGECVVASFGEQLCNLPEPVVEAPAPAPVVAPEPIAEPEPPQRVVENVSFSGDALFATNSAELTAEGKASIDPIIEGARNFNNFKISLFGHADSRGNADYNQSLSERRAQAVADYMTNSGISASAISVFGRGESEPVASNTTAEGRAKNRRVDASFSGEKITFK